MSLKPFSIGILLLSLSLGIPFLSSEEIYRWTDEKGTTHFADDVSKVPEKYRSEAERTKVIGDAAE